MAEKKFSVANIIFLIILLCGLSAISGCASQARQQMDSNHYVVQTQLQGYPCPECGHLIPVDKVSANVRTKNECPKCGKIFFGKPVAELELNEQQDQAKPYQGPNVLVRGHHHDIKHDGNTKYSVKNNWDVSEDGNSGSISSTTIITHEHNVKGEYGRTIGAAGLGRYGGY